MGPVCRDPPRARPDPALWGRLPHQAVLHLRAGAGIRHPRRLRRLLRWAGQERKLRQLLPYLRRLLVVLLLLRLLL